MRPTRLHLKNFGCYRGEQEIDFTAISSDLFAIAGPIGSGKSTVLDAITWVLFGQTPRLGAKPNEHLFTPGEDDLAVVLEFTSGGRPYRATRTLRRRPSGISPSVKLERQADSGKYLAIPETERVKEYEAALAKVIGLDYDGYVRAVMLPQGAFDEFLRGDAGKRQELFKALLKAYTIERMRDLAVAERNDVKTQFEQARARLDNEYQGVTAEREKELREDVAERERSLEGIGAKVRAHDRQVEEHAALARQDAELRAALEILEGLAAREEEIAAARARLEQGLAAEALKPVVKAFREREEELAEAARIEARRERDATDALAVQREAALALAAARSRREEQREPLQQRRKRIEAGRRDAELLKAHRASVALARDADGNAFDREELDRLVALQGQVPHVRSLEKAASNTATDLRRQEEQLEGIRKRVAAQERKVERTKVDGKAQQEAYLAADEALERARVENHALAVRQHVHVGDACPVCRNVVTSLPEMASDVDLAALERDRDEKKARFDAIKGDFRALETALGKDRETASDLERDIADRIRPAATAAATEYARALAPYRTFGDTVAGAETAIASRVSVQLARLAQRVHAVTGGRELDELEAEIERTLERLDEDVETAHSKASKAEARAETAQALLNAARDQVSKGRTKLDTAASELAAALEGSRFGSLEDAEAAALPDEQASALRTSIDEFEKEHRAAVARKDRAERELAGRAYDRQEHERVERLLEEQQALAAAKRQELGKRQQELETLSDRLRSMRDLADQAAALDRQHGVAHNLALELQSNRFEAYVLGHAQADLAMTASVIIHDVTDGRYELAYRDKEYFVRDTWMDAHERSVKTLSGGESFIVSLALALALSEIIAGQHSLGALFLDEGFGTLDAATLDSVADVLTNLTSSGRMVGVITHVTSLTDRLPARLLIRKSQRGSTAVWDA